MGLLGSTPGSRANESVTKRDLAMVLVDITGAQLALTYAIRAITEGEPTEAQRHLGEVYGRIAALHEQYRTLMDGPQ